MARISPQAGVPAHIVFVPVPFGVNEGMLGKINECLTLQDSIFIHLIDLFKRDWVAKRP